MANTNATQDDYVAPSASATSPFDQWGYAHGGRNIYTEPDNLAAFNQVRQDSAAWEAAHPRTDTQDDWLGHFVSSFVSSIPLIAAAVYGAGAAGLFDGAAAGAGSLAGDTALGSSLGDVAGGLGQLPINSGALGLDGLTVASGVGGLDAAAGAGGLGAIVGGSPAAGAGSMIGVEGGAPAVVSVGAPAATTGGLGVPAALGAGLGAGAILGSNPTQPINSGALQNPGPVNEGGTHIPDSSLPPLVTPPLANHPELGAVNPVADGAANLPYTPPVLTGGTPAGGTPTTNPVGGLPSSIPSWLQGLLPLLQGNVDKIKAQQDSDWWKSQLDSLQGMYKPGTPEATLMENKMNAMDAATGRNSQYGVRAVNLAQGLADKRAGIMTSAGYQNMANAYRNRSSQDLNGLFAGMNNSNTQNLLGSLGGTISNLFSPLTAPTQ